MTPHCANCSGIIADGTGQPFTNLQGKQFGTAWLDDYCLALLANRGYLVGSNKTGAGHLAITPLTFQRNGHLVTYWAQANYWQRFWKSRYPSRHVWAWLESLPNKELQPFKEYERKEIKEP